MAAQDGKSFHCIDDGGSRFSLCGLVFWSPRTDDVYNILVFVPWPYVCSSGYGAFTRPPDPAARSWAAGRRVAVLVLLAAALSLPLTMAVSAFNNHFGVALDDFSRALERISSSRPRIAIDPSLMIGAVPFEKWKFLRPWRQGGPNMGDSGSLCGPESVAISKQANTGLLAPQPVPGCSILVETFTSVRVNLLGKDLILIPKAYQYAIFGQD